jgi:hypothetical protein
MLRDGRFGLFEDDRKGPLWRASFADSRTPNAALKEKTCQRRRPRMFCILLHTLF